MNVFFIKKSIVLHNIYKIYLHVQKANLLTLFTNYIH